MPAIWPKCSPFLTLCIIALRLMPLIYMLSCLCLMPLTYASMPLSDLMPFGFNPQGITLRLSCGASSNWQGSHQLQPVVMSAALAYIFIALELYASIALFPAGKLTVRFRRLTSDHPLFRGLIKNQPAANSLGLPTQTLRIFDSEPSPTQAHILLPQTGQGPLPYQGIDQKN